MAALAVQLSCPRSTVPWPASTRRKADRPGRLTAVCRSCGAGLRLERRPGGLTVVSGPAGHAIVGRPVRSR